MAINNIVQFTNAIETAVPAEFTGAISAGAATTAAGALYAGAKAAGAEMYVNEYGAANAFRVVEGGASAAGTGTATEILEFEAVADPVTGEVTGANIVKMPAQGNVKAGALSGQVPIGTVAAGIAIGAGIGLKEAATHRQFWEDLVSIGDGINTPEQTIQVIWRMMQDGSIQSYCDKRTVDKIIQNFYDLQALQKGDVRGQITHAGQQEINLGTPSIEVMYKAVQSSGVPVAANNILRVWGLANQYAAGRPVNMVTSIVYRTGVNGYISVNLYNIQSTNRVVYQEGSRYTIRTTSAEQIASASMTVDQYGNELTPPGGGAGASEYAYVGTYTIGDDSRISSGGSIVTEQNPNVIIGDDTILAPEDPSDFWDTFSDWLANALIQPGYNPLNNAIVPTTWIPFTFPNINWQLDPAVGVQPDIWTGIYPFPDPFANPGADPAPDADPWIWRAIGDYLVPHIDIPYPQPTPWDDTPHVDPVKPDNPIGSTPAIVAPSSGLSNALFTVYNPTQAEVNALGAYLWTQNIVELIAQFFQNPLDAIISLHLVYCTPATGNAKNIKLGYLDSGVSAAVVTSQYVKIACGDVKIPELYNNALDYNGVDIQVFLPFVGFRKINCKEVMNATLRIIYDIDIYTGICLTSLYVVRPGVSQLLYTFEGNCSVDVPLTSADRSRLVSGLITAGVSAVTGNPAGVVGGLASVHASIERSGSFSGNAGAMGVKKPYVIIKRAISAQATNYSKQYGYPLNKSARLGAFKGFTRCQAVHADISGATDAEKAMIETQLKNGIII